VARLAPATDRTVTTAAIAAAEHLDQHRIIVTATGAACSR